jgi:hypothetical protein
MGDDSNIMRAIVIVTVSVVVISLYFSPQLKKVVKPRIVYNIEEEFVNFITEPWEMMNNSLIGSS